jgi:transposase-like protein
MSVPFPPELKEQIHRDYVTTDISIRALAEKYGVGKSTIAVWMKKESWTAEKQGCLKQAQERAKSDTGMDIAQHVDALEQRARRLYSSADKLLERVDQLLALEDALAPRDLQSLSSTLMNIKMIHGIESKPAEDTASKDVIVKLTGELMDYAK